MIHYYLLGIYPIYFNNLLPYVTFTTCAQGFGGSRARALDFFLEGEFFENVRFIYFCFGFNEMYLIYQSKYECMKTIKKTNMMAKCYTLICHLENFNTTQWSKPIKY